MVATGFCFLFSFANRTLRLCDGDKEDLTVKKAQAPPLPLVPSPPKEEFSWH
jgi:hypothetical protein